MAANKQTAVVEHYQDSDEEGRMIAAGPIVQAPGVLAIMNKSEIDQQITTARAYPRSITLVRKEVMELVTLNPIIAEQCFYALPRGGKTILGPSARFAEVMISCWGNARAAARVVDIGDEYVTAQGYFFDMQKNVAVTYEVMRRITDRNGKRYDSDLIGVTGNAACSIAIRNAVLKGIPKAFWLEAYEEARKCFSGDVKTLNNRRTEALKAFTPFGVKPDQIYGLLGIAGFDDMTLDHLVLLAGVHNAIKDGDTSPELAFAPDRMKEPGGAARPSRADFKDDKKKAAAKKADPKKDETAKADETKPDDPKKDEPKGEPAKAEETKADAAKPAEEAKPEEAKKEEPDTRTSAERAQDDYLADQLKELAKKTILRDVDDIEEVVGAQLEGDRLKTWKTACTSRAKEIMESKKGKK